jgi:hypothetical protein
MARQRAILTLQFSPRAFPARATGRRTAAAKESFSPMADKSSARTRAESHFSASEMRDALVKEEIAKERAAVDAKTAKLRALRLAREAEEKAAKATFDAANPPKPKKKSVPRRVTVG